MREKEVQVEGKGEMNQGETVKLRSCQVVESHKPLRFSDHVSTQFSKVLSTGGR